MLDLMGSEYVIDHCVAELECRFQEKAYRIYMTDVVKIIAESMRATINKSYKDIIDKTPEDTRTGDEIALDVIKRAGLKVAQNDTS